MLKQAAALGRGRELIDLTDQLCNRDFRHLARHSFRRRSLDRRVVIHGISLLWNRPAACRERGGHILKTLWQHLAAKQTCQDKPNVLPTCFNLMPNCDSV